MEHPSIARHRNVPEGDETEARVSKFLSGAGDFSSRSRTVIVLRGCSDWCVLSQDGGSIPRMHALSLKRAGTRFIDAVDIGGMKECIVRPSVF